MAPIAKEKPKNSGTHGRRGVIDVPSVSIIVPHLDDEENLNVCLTLLERQSFPRDRIEIIIADSGSACGVPAIRETVGSRGRVIAVEERGAGPARNAGAHLARGDVIAFIDSDCRPDHRWLEEGVACLAQGDVVGGQIVVSVSDPEHMSGAEVFETVFAFQNERYVREVGFTATASMFVWRDVFVAVGGFRNRVPEDKEWCRRALEKGYRIEFAKSSIVSHPARKDMSQLRRKWRRVTSESLEYQRQLDRPLALWLLREWAAFGSIAPYTLYLLRTRRLHKLRDRLSGIMALVQIRGYRFAIAHVAVLGSLRARVPHPKA